MCGLLGVALLGRAHAPVLGLHLGLDARDVLPAPLPRGLVARLAFSGEAHVVVLTYPKAGNPFESM